MTKKEWHENRILLRANRRGLFDIGYERFENISSEKQRVISDMFGDTRNIVLVLWESDNKFSLISTDEFFSNYDSDIFRIRLDDIKEVKSDWDDSKSQWENKTQTEYFFVNNHKVWSGKNQWMSGLMNLLMMFPLKVPK